MNEWIVQQICTVNYVMFFGILGFSHYFNKKLIDKQTEFLKDEIRDVRRIK